MSEPKARNIVFSQSNLSRDERETLLGQRGCVLWFTGLSGSGKSTIARAVEERLVRNGRLAYVLDGDNVRHGLNRDLGFTAEERRENIRRIGEVVNLYADAAVIALAAFISPYREDRSQARSIMDGGRFIEIHVDTPLEECERRDVKGLYAKARAGEIPNFTGIDAPYEEPVQPEIVLHTIDSSVEDSAKIVIDYLLEHDLISFGDEVMGTGI